MTTATLIGVVLQCLLEVVRKRKSHHINNYDNNCFNYLNWSGALVTIPVPLGSGTQEKITIISAIMNTITLATLIEVVPS